MRHVLDDAEDCHMSMCIYRCHVMMCMSRYGVGVYTCAKEPYKTDTILQKRPMILSYTRSLWHDDEVVYMLIFVT